MKVKYIGPHTDGVEIVDGDRVWDCPHGAAVDVPLELAKRLLEQPTNWVAEAPGKDKK